MPKKKLSNFKQTDGKLDTFQYTNVEQIWGQDKPSQYNTTDEDEYLKELEKLDSADLRTHATKVGIIPCPERKRLVQRLTSQFRRQRSKFLVKPRTQSALNSRRAVANKKLPDRLKSLFSQAK